MNGQTKQRDVTKNMHFKIDEIMSYVSHYIKLEDGDLLLTGTPEGVGPVKGGDKVEAVGRIGESIVARL